MKVEISMAPIRRYLQFMPPQPKPIEAVALPIYPELKTRGSVRTPDEERTRRPVGNHPILEHGRRNFVDRRANVGLWH